MIGHEVSDARCVLRNGRGVKGRARWRCQAVLPRPGCGNNSIDASGVGELVVDAVLRIVDTPDFATCWTEVDESSDELDLTACVYLERSRTLIAGDALTAADGRLQGPAAEATEDMDVAMSSVRRLAGLDVRAIVCYPGGVVDDDAASQLHRLAAESGRA